MNLTGQSCRVIGLMSGTSLDGLDLAACIFNDANNPVFEIVEARTIKYTDNFRNRLKVANHLDLEDLMVLDYDFASLCADEIKKFVRLTGFVPDLISSHGHTVLHRPDLHYTLQIGHPGTIASLSGYKTAGDFRTQNVAMGGQGAPLVPIGDELLFNQYDACLNLGGIANISFNEDNTRVAWDICVLNMALNFVANTIGMDYDINGQIASRGNANQLLIEELNSLDYFSQNYPKSLGREWFENIMLPVVEKYDLSPEDLLASLIEHQVAQMQKAIPEHISSVLVTGGAAFNLYLLERMKSISRINWVLPDAQTINFKEALVFAFLGYLRLYSRNNCLAGVTGSSIDHCSGGLYLP